VDVLLARDHGQLELTRLVDGSAQPSERLVPAELPARVAALEGPDVRWVWADTRAVYPALLAAGVRVGRAVDLRLCHPILRHSVWTRDSALARRPASRWDTAAAVVDDVPTLLDELGRPDDVPTAQLLAELRDQQLAVAGSEHPGRLRLLTAAESAGGLIAAEMRHVGMPFDVAAHDRRLTELLGPRPLPGGRPDKLERLVEQIRALLGAPGLNPDSQPALLRALRAAGVEVASTRRFELATADHPVVPVLLQYKKLARLLAANGWAWADAWVRRGRFHPDYVPGGVVTGRWATVGGGALQLPKQIRAAVAADPGWRLVVADAAQLEPRVLAAMAGDAAMARASRGRDLYAGLVTEGVVGTRPQAKLAMLSALYGATSGEAGQLMPNLMRAYPAATGLVERAARDGERGQQVHTWLGRTSPPPGSGWHAGQQRANQPDAADADERRARREARDWGRFTRNFVVQGSAAEWALCWLAAVRRDLTALAGSTTPDQRPDLVYFLHDEIMVHTPAGLADPVAEIVRAGAAEAGRLMFGETGVEFAIELAVVGCYAEA
jgi:DNA polymerase I